VNLVKGQHWSKNLKTYAKETGKAPKSLVNDDDHNI
jgi:hypothetical protein